MDSEALFDALYDLSFTAGMNQRYHQIEWTASANIDNTFRIAVAVLAVLSTVASIYSAFKGDKSVASPWWVAKVTYNRVSVALAIGSLAVAVWLNITPSGSDVVYHSDLFRRWSELRRDADNLMFAVEHAPEGELPGALEERIQELLARKNQINSIEYAADEELLTKCYEAENRARTDFRNPEEQKEHEDKQASVTAMLSAGAK